tara:strand:- start:416 stop:676 length:261 start_codon:yes stop_codon:yes gene_type:complete
MDSLLLIFLLLGATPAAPSNETDSTHIRVQTVASANILRGEVIHLGESVSLAASRDSSNIFQLAPMRSAGEIASVDGGTIQLQEFH